MDYTFNSHVHRFSVWTASRAAQRGFTTIKNIEKAINQTQLQRYVENPPKGLTDEVFDIFHRKTARILIKELKRTVSNKEKATYGRAAKITSVYIKSAYILPNKGSGELSKIAHPPIDRILLQNIHREHKEFGFKKVNWTELNEEGYIEVIKKLRELDYKSFWELERYWYPA